MSLCTLVLVELALLHTVVFAPSLVAAAPEPLPQIGASALPTAGMETPSFRALGDDAVTAIIGDYYAGHGLWRDCPRADCWVHNNDWGSDSLTNTLYLRWRMSGDAGVLPMLAALARTERTYRPPCAGRRCLLWSDVPMWDSVAASREHEALPNDPVPMRKAQAAFWAVEGSPVYDVGACPAIRYQRPYGRGDRLKTLETDSNGIKAALLLYAETRERRYLAIAMTRYHAARRYFLDPKLALYTVYVFDDGRHCAQAPHRYFASVNGNMIWNGLQLANDTGNKAYRAQALHTARAVVDDLSDANGIFADLQAENDLEEPLIEAMLELASTQQMPFARRWLLLNAAAAYSARRQDGTYGRFFDGPPPVSAVTAWQSNGGFAAEIAAAALAPRQRPPAPAWSSATFVSQEIAHTPFAIRFHGRGFALVGTIGEICCQPGHARIAIDGVETTNHIGTWQNKSSSGRRFPNSVLFAWQWPTSREHVITLLPGAFDAKEGGPFLHARGYLILGDRPSPMSR